MRVKRTWPLILSLALIGLGCEEKDKLDNMHDSTVDMSKTTNEMNSNTRELLRLTQILAGKTESMYHQLRSKEAQETRDRSLNSLYQAKTFEEKLTKSVPYLQGFEFHLWTNGKNGIDTDHFRQKLMTEAVDEFFRAMQTTLGEVDPYDVSPSDKNNNPAQSLFAIAASLHKVHHAQDHVKFDDGKTAKSYGFKKWSFLDMIKTALRSEKLLEKGEITLEDIPEWQEALLYRPWKESAYALLHMRMQIIPAIALASINPDVKDDSFIGFFKKIRYLIAEWEGKYDELNHATQKEVNEQLEEAVKTKKFLKEMGKNPELDGKLEGILEEMQIRDCPESCFPGEKKRLEEFRGYLKELL